MGGRGAVPLAVAFWLGLVAGAHAGMGAIAASLAAALALAALALRAPLRTGALLLSLAAFSLGLARGGARATRLEALRARVPVAASFARVVVVLDEPARRETGVPQALARVLAASPPLPWGLEVRLRLPPACAADWGDTLAALVRLEPFPPIRNPGGFDARAAADAAGALAHGRAYTALVSPQRSLAAVPVRLAMRLRRAMESALARGLTPAARELASPLLFGDRSAMTPELDAELRGSGLVHLLALSGLHVIWLAGAARGLAALARGGRRTRALAGAACAVGYALVAGPLPSLMRAVAAELATTAARLAQRALDPLQSLAAGMLVLLALAPGWAGDLGFQLSCAATLGLVTLTAPLEAPLARAGRWAALARPFTTTLAAQAAALPLLLSRFHALPWTGLVANLPAVPVSELLLAGAWIGGLADAALPGAGAPWLHACEPLAWALRAIAAATSALPGSLLAAGGDPAPVALAAAGVAALGLGLALPRELHARRFGRSPARSALAGLGATLLGCGIVAALTARPLAPPPGRWWLVGIDVGQGDALALAFEDGWWLVDAGPRSPEWDAGEGMVLPFLRWAGVRRLERLVLTHDDGDHTGGAAAVRRSLAVRETDASAPRPGVAGPAARYGARTLGRGDTLRRTPPARVLWPPRPGESGEALSRRGDNAAALVIEVGEGRGRALLTADADSLVERVLAVAPGIAVLKAGHHGSGSSSGAAFVRALRPARVLVSVGAHNAYGHPDPRALERLALTGAVIDRTDREGAIWYELSAAGVRRLDWRRGLPSERTARRTPPRGPAP